MWRAPPLACGWCESSRNGRIAIERVVVDSERVVPHPDPASIAQLSQMIAGARIGQILAVAADLGIPDLLKDGPRSVGELSEATGTYAPSLHRLMRALASLGLVETDRESYV